MLFNNIFKSSIIYTNKRQVLIHDEACGVLHNIFIESFSITSLSV